VKVTLSELSPLVHAVNGPIIGQLDGRPAILGGWVGPADSAAWSEQGFFLDEDGVWEELSGIEGRTRADAAVVVSGSSLILAGGRDGDDWTRDVAVLTRDGSRVAFRALADLPDVLRRPAGVSSNLDRTLSIAGFSGDPAEGVTIVLFQIDLSLEGAGWERMEPLPAEGEGDLLVAIQNEGFYVTLSPDDGSDARIFRHRRFDGWVERTGPGPGTTLLSATSLGQAHIGYPSRRGTGEVGETAPSLLSYSAVTDTWVDIGRWGATATDAEVVAIGPSLLVAHQTADRWSFSRAAVEVDKGHFYWIDYAAVGLYLLCMILIGFYFSRRETGTDDFFVGGRRMPWWAVGFSLYATGTSAISFMAIPAKSYATDWLYFAQNIVGFVAIIPVALIIVPLIRRLSLTTTYEYLEMRFHSVIRIIGSVICVVYQLGARMSVVLFLPALALSAVTGVGVVESIVIMGIIATVYTVLGGIKAVIWTDVVQVVVLLGGAFLCLVIILTGVDGGLSGFISVASEDAKMRTFDWRLDLTIPTMWLFLLLASADTLTWPKDQVMVQRVLSTKSDKEAGWSVWTLMAIVAPGSLLFFSLGTAVYTFYKMHPERLSPLLNLDATIPYFIAAELPPGVTGLIIAALFAASMSTLDSSMNSVATVMVVDFYKKFKKNVSDQVSLKIAKWITVVTGVFGTGFALILSRYSLPSLWDAFIMLTGLLGGGFGGVYTLGMFSRRANWQGALIGTIASIVVTLAVKQYTNIHVLLYVGVAVITCVVVGYLSSFFFPMQEEKLKGLTVFKVDN
jgi:SSS family transporter